MVKKVSPKHQPKKHMEIIKLKRRSDLAYVCMVDYGSGEMEVVHFSDFDRTGTIPKRTVGTDDAIKSKNWTQLERAVCKWVNLAFNNSKTKMMRGVSKISVQPELDFFDDTGRKWFKN